MGDRVRLTALANAALFVAAAVGLVTVDEDKPHGVLVAAAEATARTGTAAFSLHASMRMGDEPTAIAATGRIDFERKRFTLVRETPRSELLVADGVTYTSLEAAAPQRWLVVDNRPRQTAASPFGLGLTADDPLAALDQLRRAGFARDVRADGTEDVRGVPTTRWVADIDPAALSAASGRNRQFLEAIGLKEMRYSMWVGTDSVLRRVSTVAEGTIMSSSMTIEFFDFGTAAPVEVPPPDQVRHLELPD
ncbi:MAG TPA: hypothetical protein VM938_08930 [Acidimicrobiales bacterium]|nr:hypothetical protein [Acidimicrobiales bacterium]